MVKNTEIKTQRKTRNLGLNRTKDKEKIYSYIEKELGIKTKYCSRGNSKRTSKYAVLHTGPNPAPIRNFNLEGAYVDPSGNVIIKKTPGLQPYCISCEKAYRRGRLTKWNAKYSRLTDQEIYNEYRRQYGPTCRCSKCKKNKKPEEFPISRRMDRGLHNLCKECSKATAEAVGNRWIIYSPDGSNSIQKTAGVACAMCGKILPLHKDHIWPISKGGADFEENIQLLCGPCNESKSDTIVGIENLGMIHDRMICKRYWPLLKQAKHENWSVQRFELAICKQVREFIEMKKKMDDAELERFFQAEKERNNRKHGTARAVRKFRKYSEDAIIDIGSYIENQK